MLHAWDSFPILHSTTQKLCMDTCSADLWDRNRKDEAFTHAWEIQPQFPDQTAPLVPRSLNPDEGDLLIEIIAAFGLSVRTLL